MVKLPKWYSNTAVAHDTKFCLDTRTPTFAHQFNKCRKKLIAIANNGYKWRKSPFNFVAEVRNVLDNILSVFKT